MAGSGEPMEDSSSLSPAPESLDEEALMMSAPEGSWPPSSSRTLDGKCIHLCTSLYLGTRLTWEGVDLMGQAWSHFRLCPESKSPVFMLSAEPSSNPRVIKIIFWFCYFETGSN